MVLRFKLVYNHLLEAKVWFNQPFSKIVHQIATN